MPCTNHSDALIEAASTGAEPQGELRAHLNACAACRSAFAQEQALFSSIDTGLRFTANAEVPASLVPRVRARLDETAAPRRRWGTNWLVLASAAAVLVAFLVARAVWRPNISQNSSAGSAQANPSAPVFPPPEHTQAPERSAKNNLLPRPHTLPPRNSHNFGVQAVRDSIPEVLVPRDQEVLLAEYAEQWRQHKYAPLLAQAPDATIFALLQVAPIQIDELDVKPLAEKKSQ